MRKSDRTPLKDTPVANRIAALHNNRLGAVYASLYAFWQARHAAGDRRDAYSVLLHDDEVITPVVNDLTRTPDDLLARVLPHKARLGTNFTKALKATQSCMERHWSAERCVPQYLRWSHCRLIGVTLVPLSSYSCLTDRVLWWMTRCAAFVTGLSLWGTS